MIKRVKCFLFALYTLLLIIAQISLSSCAGGSQVPPVVCEYGGLVCETADVLCETIPQIPPEVCSWIELACVNLTILCEYDPGTPEYIEASEKLASVNDSLRQWISEKVNAMQKE